MVDVILSGGFGKLGQAILKGLQESEYKVVGILSGHVHENENVPCPVWTSLDDINISADIFLDVSTPSTVYDNAQWAIKHNMALVVGTTGLQESQISYLEENTKKGVVIAPNFSLSAVLLMKFAQLAAEYFPDVEIVEAHNPKKVDSPSGTAIQTAKLISLGRSQVPQQTKDGLSRGEKAFDVPIHALRLPGYIAEQTVYFGGVDEQLTLKQSTTSRTAFVPGVIRALDGVQKIDHLVVGLEHLL